MRVLDTAATERFDRITRLAQQLFGAAGAEVNLIDRDRQWTKSSTSQHGSEVARDESFCSRTILQPDLLVVADAREDERFRDLQFVQSGGVRFYAGVPLLGAGGERVGALCVFGPEPRTLNGMEGKLLTDLARWAQDELNQAAEAETGFQVQQGLLPSPLVSLEGYDVAGVSRPMSAVGGDFYDWYPVKSGAAFTFGDVMGKGIAAALIAATVRATMRASSRVDGPAAAVETAADTLDADLSGAGAFVTLFHGHLNEDSGVLRYIDAGYGLSTVMHADQSSERLEPTGVPLGAGWENTWEERSVRLLPGDAFIAVSDGVLDAFGGRLDSLSRVEELAREGGDSATIAHRIMDAAMPTAPDDVSVIVLQRDTVLALGR